MRSQRRLLLPVLVVWVLSFVLLHQHFRPTIDSYGFNAIDSHLTLIAPEPAGEIVADFRLVAQLAPLDAKVAQIYASAPICIALKLATYRAPILRGSFQLDFETNGKMQSRNVPATSVQNDRIRVECFEQLTYRDMETSTASLTIKGVDGIAGSAVTAWLSQAEDAARITINGEPQKTRLMYALGRYLDATGERMAAWALLATGSLIASIILVLGLRRD
jgi:hypothetical protein